MVFNRLLEPSSKLRVSEWVTTQAIHEIFLNEVPLHQYYRSLDYLMAHKTSLEGDCCDIAKRGLERTICLSMRLPRPAMRFIRTNGALNHQRETSKTITYVICCQIII